MSDHVIPIYTNNRVTPLIHGNTYLRALSTVLSRLGRGSLRSNRQEFIYLSAFALNLVYPDDPLHLPTQSGPVRLVDLLIEKAGRGVDVRVMGWLSWALGAAGRLDARPESRDNVRTVLTLRSDPAMKNRAMLNILGHPAGGAHAKLAVAGGPGWAMGFTGGVDLSPDRFGNGWLDVQAQVEGPAVQAIYDFFRQQWNDNLALTNHTGIRLLRARRPLEYTLDEERIRATPDGVEPVPPRHLDTAPVGSHQVQSLRTIPQFNFHLSPLIPLVAVSPLPSAPHGLFEVRDAWRAAILTAQDYVYIEDQYFWSVEALGWVRTALQNNSGLRVVLLTGESNQLVERLPRYRTIALRTGLLEGLDEEQRSRVTILKSEHMIHAKTTLIDDRWALLGSTNCARRSLYTDIEHSISVTDEDNQFVRDYRVNLWAAHTSLDLLQRETLLDPRDALVLWNPEWGRKQTGLLKRNGFSRLEVDLTAPLPEIDQEWYSMVDDPDSRQPWHFPLRREYPTDT